MSARYSSSRSSRVPVAKMAVPSETACRSRTPKARLVRSGRAASWAKRANSRPALIGVDNTLLDNDAAKAALASRIGDAVPPEVAQRFWELYERVRDAKEYVDFPATVARLGLEHAAAAARIGDILDSLPYRVF